MPTTGRVDGGMEPWHVFTCGNGHVTRLPNTSTAAKLQRDNLVYACNTSTQQQHQIEQWTCIDPHTHIDYARNAQRSGMSTLAHTPPQNDSYNVVHFNTDTQCNTGRQTTHHGQSNDPAFQHPHTTHHGQSNDHAFAGRCHDMEISSMHGFLCMSPKLKNPLYIGMSSASRYESVFLNLVCVASSSM